MQQSGIFVVDPVLGSSCTSEYTAVLRNDTSVSVSSKKSSDIVGFATGLLNTLLLQEDFFQSSIWLMVLVNTQESIASFLEKFASDIREADGAFITVDTEFIRENQEIPLLCLVQIATSNTVFIIDPLKVDISFLKPIFEDEKLLKVFHACTQDIEILRIYGINVKNLYDTQFYEMLLSTSDRISYQDIVKKYLDKNLNKNYSTSNWLNRPLSKKQLLYSEEDVLYLRDVYKEQLASIKKINRHDWLLDEMSSFCEKSETSLIPAGDKKVQLFNQLAEWRSNKAIENSVDVQSIARNSLLNDICRKGVSFVRSVRNSRWMTNDVRKEFLKFAEQLTENLEIVKKAPVRNVSVYLLKAILEMKSIENNIAPSLISTTSELEKLSNGNYDVKCLHGWRKEIFGNYALSFLKGELSISLKDSKVILE
ncbi:ribonuclease D [Alphaproteobacteria bacterium]|nr:ribonuclease D [Alphaproteobacteria bacterium]